MTKPTALRVLKETKDESDAVSLARAGVGPTVGATVALDAINRRAAWSGATDPSVMRAELERVTRDGGATGTDRLLAQAVVLDRLFTHFTTEAMQTDSINRTVLNLKLAFRAQAQCRATLAAVSDIRHPRQYVGTQHVGEQYNAGGHQQVNRDARADVRKDRPTEVSEVSTDGAEHELHPDD